MCVYYSEFQPQLQNNDNHTGMMTNLCVLFGDFPILLGPSNFDYWDDVFRAWLAYEDLEEHLAQFPALPSSFLKSLNPPAKTVEDADVACKEIQEKISGLPASRSTTYRSCAHSTSAWEAKIKYYFDVTRTNWQKGEKKVDLIIKVAVKEV